MNTFYQQLGLRIRRERNALGFTQQELCDATGLKRPTLVSIETGTGQVRVEVLARLAWALGVDMVDLVPVVTSESQPMEKEA